MKLVMVEDLKEGDILANDVLLEDYTVVLSKGTEIKEPYNIWFNINADQDIEFNIKKAFLTREEAEKRLKEIQE